MQYSSHHAAWLGAGRLFIHFKAGYHTRLEFRLPLHPATFIPNRRLTATLPMKNSHLNRTCVRTSAPGPFQRQLTFVFPVFAFPLPPYGHLDCKPTRRRLYGHRPVVHCSGYCWLSSGFHGMVLPCNVNPTFCTVHTSTLP